MSNDLSPIEQYDKDLLEHAKDGNTTKAQFAGLLSGLIGAILWGLLTYFSHLIIGYFAIGLGLIVGISVKYFGKGSGSIFGFIGGAYALTSCFLGMLFSIIFFAAASEKIPFFEVLFMVDYNEIAKLYLQNFEIIDMVFYSIAFGTAFKISMNPYGKDELDYLLEAKGINPSGEKIDKDHFKKLRRK